MKDKMNNYQVGAIIDKNRANDKIILRKGDVVKEIPAVIFDNRQKKKILELID